MTAWGILSVSSCPLPGYFPRCAADVHLHRVLWFEEQPKRVHMAAGCRDLECDNIIILDSDATGTAAEPACWGYGFHQRSFQTLVGLSHAWKA